MDTMSPQQRHKNMAAIRSADTKPEMTVRRWLHSRGFRYRLNHPRLPGHPDIVLRKYRTCIFVNGCFWHGHEGCRYFRLPKTNIDFWRTKIERNRERDRYLADREVGNGPSRALEYPVRGEEDGGDGKMVAEQ